MADEPTAPAFDTDALARSIGPMIHTAVRSTISDMQQDAAKQAREEAARRAAAADANARASAFASDPVAQTVAPIAQEIARPAMQRAAIAELKAESAQDAMLFYLAHPEAVAHKDGVERIFQTCIQQGKPWDHETCWHQYVGQNKEKFVEAEIAARDNAAHAGSTLGPSGASHPSERTVTFTPTTPLDDMRKALDGVAL